MSVVTLVSIAIFVSLGFWQVSRLHEKEAHVAQMTEHMTQKPVALEELLKSGEPMEKLDYYSVIISGSLMPEKSLKLSAQAHEGKLGYHLIVPLQLSQGSVILVDLGWVNQKHTIDLHSQSGVIQIQGYIKKALKPNRFTPDNDFKTGEIFSIEPQELAKHLEINTLLPFYVVATQTISNPDLVANTGEVVVQNYHLSYALTWFSLAVVWAALFVLYVRKKITRSNSTEMR